MDKDWIFLLGAPDPEMREIERTLASAKLPRLYAAAHHRRCNRRNAYDADGALEAGWPSHSALLLPHQPIVTVECALSGRTPVYIIDHHNPGDPGYEQPPERYLEGSSLGQLLRLLERDADPTQRLLAAADHCLTAAYQGACPGIDPNELLFLRAAWQAKTSGRSLSDVVEGILDAASKVRLAFDSEYGESLFLDPTELPRDLAEGAAYAGKAVRYRAFGTGWDIKEMIKGAAPGRIEAFMRGHEAAGRVVYGNPYRGYAGAYLD